MEQLFCGTLYNNPNLMIMQPEDGLNRIDYAA
jgi:hypothetical protein